MRFPYHILPVLILTACFVGCPGGNADQVPVYPVSGVITMDGAPVVDATVTFSPKGSQPVAVGKTDAQGQYKLRTYEEADGAAAGEYAVLVSKPVDAGGGLVGHDANAAGGPPGGHRAGQQAGTALPEQYANAADTPLTATVTEGGENNFPFELEK